MGLFQKLETAQAILSVGGVYQQVDLYEWNGGLFAKHGAGYVRLYADGSTSKPKLVIQQLSLDQPLARDPLGKLVSSNYTGVKVTLASKQSDKLLGAPDVQAR